MCPKIRDDDAGMSVYQPAVTIFEKSAILWNSADISDKRD